jgi:hypothetical protein
LIESISFSFVQLALVHITPLVYTGKFFGSISNEMRYPPVDIEKPSTIGYYRLLETQLRLVSEWGGEDKVPREDWCSRLVLWYIPVLYFLFWVVFSMIYNLDFLAGTHILSDCYRNGNLFAYLQMFFIPGLICWTLPITAVLVSLYGLYIGSLLCTSSIYVWCARYRCLKNIGLDDPIVSDLPLGILRKDAFENYFLIQKVTSVASSLWNLFLVIYFSLTSLAAIFTLALIWNNSVAINESNIAMFEYL